MLHRKQCSHTVCVVLCRLLSPVRRELHSDCLALLQAPHIQESSSSQLTLPLDINNYPFYRYVQIYFRVSANVLGALQSASRSPVLLYMKLRQCNCKTKHADEFNKSKLFNRKWICFEYYVVSL